MYIQSSILLSTVCAPEDDIKDELSLICAALPVK
jgi:hypothetical protein